MSEETNETFRTANANSFDDCVHRQIEQTFISIKHLASELTVGKGFMFRNSERKHKLESGRLTDQTSNEFAADRSNETCSTSAIGRNKRVL